MKKEMLESCAIYLELCVDYADETDAISIY
jgi:hypothetical protein